MKQTGGPPRFFYCLPIGPVASSVWVSHRGREESDGRKSGGQEGCVAGHFGADGAENAASDGAAARLRDCAAHRADQRRSAGGELRNFVPGAAETRAGGLHQLGMGLFRQQSQGEILQAYARGAETAEQGGAGVGTDNRDPCALSGAWRRTFVIGI